MFHVEQTTPRGDVEYRLRWPDSAHEALREWGGERRAMHASFPLTFGLEDPGVAVEAQWRYRGDDWQDCQAMEFAPSIAMFRVVFENGRSAGQDRELDVMGVVGDFTAVFRLRLEEGEIAPGGQVVLEGQSLELGPGQFFKPGQFHCHSTGIRVTGLDCGQVTLRNADRAVPGKSASPPRPYLVRTARALPPEEITEFLKQQEVSRG